MEILLVDVNIVCCCSRLATHAKTYGLCPSGVRKDVTRVTIEMHNPIQQQGYGQIELMSDRFSTDTILFLIVLCI